MKTDKGFNVEVGELKEKNATIVIQLCNKIDGLFSYNSIEWSEAHKRFYKCLNSALHLIKHQCPGTPNLEFDTYTIDKNLPFKQVDKFYLHKNSIYDILRRETDRMHLPLPQNEVLYKGVHRHPYIVKKARRNTLDRYHIRYDILTHNGNKIEVDSESDWWDDVKRR